MDEFDDLAKRAIESMKLTQKIRRMFEGKPPEMQGAILADLLACWIAGHVSPGDDEATKDHRELILQIHLAAVRALIPVNYRLYIKPQLKDRRH
jgi:hypothetical protein